jgi:hypothetical protein
VAMRAGDREGRGSLGHGDIGDEAARGEGSDVATKTGSGGDGSAWGCRAMTWKGSEGKQQQRRANDNR